MSSLTFEMIEQAYDKLVRIENSAWLSEVRTISSRYYQQVQQEPHDVQHLMICFDDGPCYEFICVGFTVRA